MTGNNRMKVKCMKCVALKTMIAAIVAIIFVTGFASAQISPVDPSQPPVVEPPQPPTPTPTPTLRQPVGVLPEPPVDILPDTPAGEPTQAPTQPPEPTQPPAPTPTVGPTQVPTLMPTIEPAQPQSPTIGPTQPPVTQPQGNDSTGAGMQVSSGPGDKLFPAIAGNSIVWVDDRSTSVQLYDIRSGNTSTISGATSIPLGLAYELATDGNSVVWTGENPQAEGDILFLYDITSGRLQQVTDGSGVPGYPGVSQNYVVWVDGDELGDVYIYDIASGNSTTVTADPYLQLWADIGGNTIIWGDNETEEGDLDIAVLTLEQPRVRLLGDSGDDGFPDVSSDGNYVAWINARDNQTTVYLYDVLAENITQITGESANPDAVAVDGNHVVYSDWRSGSLDIYVYDIATRMETPVTRDPYMQSYPDISEGTIVWMGNNTGQWEIYAYQVARGPPPTPVQPTPVQPTPVQPTPVQPTPVQPTPVQISQI